MPLPQALTPEFLSQLGSLELRSRAIADHVSSGEHRGRRRGPSVDFADHRLYSPGDDPRYLDWKLFGKRDRLHVREFEQDSRLTVWCLVDISPSMDYRWPGRSLSKFEYASSLAGAIGWLAAQQRDEVGLAVFAEEGRFLSAFPGERHRSDDFVQVLESLGVLAPQTNAALNRGSSESLESWTGLEQLATRVTDRSLVFVLTDGLGDADLLLRTLSLMQSRHCEVRLLQILDPAELEFPFEEDVILRDLEGGTEPVVISPAIRQNYQREINTFLQTLQSEVRSRDMQYARVLTTQPLDLAVLSIIEESG